MSNYIDIFKPYVDKFDCVGNWKFASREIEVGDSCQRLGMIYAFENWTGKQVLNYRNDKVMAHGLLTPPRRHLNNQIWEGQAGSLSRDNATPMIVANSYYAKDIFFKLLKRFGFFWNYKDLEGEVKTIPITDFAGPIVFGAIVRSAGWWLLYPTLIVTDLFLLINTLFRVLYSRTNPTHTSDELNTQVLLEQASRRFPTPLGWLANFYYFKHGPKWALHSYFRKRDNMMPPPIYLLYTCDLFKEKWKSNQTMVDAQLKGLRL